jgi:4-amino-4-deoxy-L-arabinose transferase-like glycosyltransferase
MPLRRYSKLPESMLKKTKKSIIKEVKNHLPYYILFALVLSVGLFFRTYRLDQLIGFYYDQGRDALVIWRLWHTGKLFLVGPVTGLAGIFLGPFYYYMIAPFYLMGGGDPVYPAVFLAALATAGVFMLYLMGSKMHSRASGIVAAVIGALSYYLILAGRWLANPTAILLTSMLLLWCMWEIVSMEAESEKDVKKKGWLWVSIATLVGISLHFEAASAVFFIPVVVVFAVWQRNKLPNRRFSGYSLLILFLTFLPQILFNFRHDNILFDNFRKVFFEKQSFKVSFWDVLGERLDYFWDVFSSKILPGRERLSAVFTLLSVVGLTKVRGKTKKSVVLLLIFIGIPMLGFIAFQGNEGNIYDYYMTGYYYPLVLLFSLGLGEILRSNWGKAALAVFFLVFLKVNLILDINYVRAGVDGPTHITLGNEVQAVDWVIEDAGSRGDFNVDVYVPPVIPHSYDYLFLWRTTQRCGKDMCGMLLDERVPLLYTLYEVDNINPGNLARWLERQRGIGEVKERVRFGGITVERRERLPQQ